jgi:hypothetical protein
MEGVTVKTPVANYMDFVFFDIHDYHNKKAQILITPILKVSSGSILASDSSLNVNFGF